jgi:cysteine desulfurase
MVPGGAQEKRRRGGTEAVAALVGFGQAAACSARETGSEAVRLAELRDLVEARLAGTFRDLRVHGAGAARVPGTLNFGIPGVPGEMLVIALDLAGFALSTGSACASGAIEPSHVLRAMGLSEDRARGAVRLSLGWSTSADDVEQLLGALPEIVARVRTAGVSASG